MSQTTSAPAPSDRTPVPATACRRSRGQSLIEFALVLPVFLLLFATAVDAGRLFFGYVTVTNAAREGAMFGAQTPQCQDDTVDGCANPNNVRWRVTQDAGPMAASTTVTVTCLAPDGTARASLPACDEGDTYRVSVAYPFDLLTPATRAVLGPTLSLSASSSALVFNPATYTEPTPTPQPTATADASEEPTATPPLVCDAPTIDFSANRTKGQVPLVVTFSGTSNRTPTSVRWTFGDGGESTEWPSTTYTFTQKARYDITLTVNVGGQDQTCSTTVTKAEYIQGQ